MAVPRYSVQPPGVTSVAAFAAPAQKLSSASAATTSSTCRERIGAARHSSRAHDLNARHCRNACIQ
jgi:hypothetical protein